MSYERAVVTIGSRTFDTWESYDLQSDMLTPADAFTLMLPFHGATRDVRAELRARIEEGARVSIYIGSQLRGQPAFNALQITGIITKRSWSSTSKGEVIHLEGLDNGGLLTTASADVRVSAERNARLVDVVRSMIEPFGMTLITDSAVARQTLTGAGATVAAGRLAGERAAQTGPRAARGFASRQSGADVERLTLADAKPQVGETVWEFIERHASRVGVHAWIDPQGRVILAAPNYDQDASYRLVRRLQSATSEPNNILEGHHVEELGGLSSEVTVYGHSGRGASGRSRISATATNSDVPVYRPLIVHDQSVRTSDEARRRAQREIAKQRARQTTIRYVVPGHSQQRRLWAVDTIVDVYDEALQVEGPWYVAGRRFSASRESGVRTELSLVPKGAIVL